MLTVVAALSTAGGMGLVWTSPIWGACALLAVIPAGGRKLIEWAPIPAVSEGAGPISGSSSTAAASSGRPDPAAVPILAVSEGAG